MYIQIPSQYKNKNSLSRGLNTQPRFEEKKNIQAFIKKLEFGLTFNFWLFCDSITTTKT